ncbi:oligopeptide ABC transporter substrate-binding protein [Lactobacillus sp. LL6]|uniref:oligopeptide ABC transporter substrate-binding protein n=1 Tax=Lactobacillus sp. LL6 TaxID=2596827 RepID=UPI001184C810|nr:oligopeptide ABC transporter substrate-binding protein [Lactobacillus sp. LL6]TSO26135.1 oligopeptide ABC transporter substrate-binding protein [Lactobacillus sp. LL6]
MNKTKLFMGTTMLSVVAMTLAACGKSNKSAETKTIKPTEISALKTSVPEAPTKQGGTVKTALISDSPFTGIFITELQTTTVDTAVSQYGIEDLFGMNDHYVFNNNGPATLKLDQKAKTATINIKKGVKWSDGKQVTARDYVYAYEVLANPEAQNPKYNGSLTNIIGMEDYHNGKSKTISGIKMPDGANGRKIVIHFKEMKPGMKQSGNGYIHEVALPYHYLKDVSFNKLISSDKIRKKPLFYGPYQVKDIVRGESVTWVPNKYYWRGTPKLSKIEISVVSSTSATEALKAHQFDVIQVQSSKWNDIKKTKGFNFVKGTVPQYTYLGFKVGKWENNKNVMDKNSKMNNKSLRQAIAYGMNIEGTYGKMSNGAAFRIPTLIPTQFGDYSDKNIKGYTYNIKKANQLLDKAGYKKKGTYRIQPNGKKLTIRLAAMGSGDAAKNPVIQTFIQDWKKMGLNVKLTDNRLLDQNIFLDKLQHDDSNIDMFINAWNLATEPSPAMVYGEKTPMNYGRFVTKKNNQLIKEIDSQKAFNHSYRVDKFHEWQKYMNDEAYVVPMYNAYQVTAVNSKLTGYSTSPSKSMGNKLPNWYYVGYKK